MGVSMRSNDVVFGYCNDVFTFALFQQLMLNDLRAIYPDLELGSYHHHAGSMHIYERHYEMAKNILDIDKIGYKKDNKVYKLKDDVTSHDISEKKLYLPSEDLDKDEISDIVSNIVQEIFE